ncbi:hypothetical protein LCGC14_1176260 [marine sediment metagenome]|uniref:Homing endonuclease LAGLIDADG domain-containing protein n=2 Tax=marine sediment metagenome TaxID=412755 RepID=A0A0F9MBC6_9ZZZZ
MCIEAYAAALLDGEGCIQVGTNGSFPLRVRFGMTDRAPLDVLAGEWGGNVNTLKQRPGERLVYYWDINCSYALGFLKAVEPWVYGKIAQVELALTYPLFGKRGHTPLPVEVAESRVRIREGLRAVRESL